MKIEEKVFSYIEEYKMIETGSQVLLGISGGADSVCLLFLLKEYQKRKDFSLRGMHINHGIRGKEAVRDQEFTRELCERLEVPLAVRYCPVPEMAAEQKLSLEEAGRIARRRAFSEEGRAWKKDPEKFRIALAHHENDQAETVLHNLIRGTGAGGLAGIRPVQREKKQVYIRPLLCVSREEIREYLKEKGISWVEGQYKPGSVLYQEQDTADPDTPDGEDQSPGGKPYRSHRRLFGKNRGISGRAGG